MTAIPAWPLNSLPRLFIDEKLSVEQNVAIEGQAFHYLCRVMRRTVGDQIKCFDDRTGEYLAEITAVDKRKCQIMLIEKLKEREETPDLWLCAAPLKRDRWMIMAEKSCELGISAFVPVQTQRTIIDKIKDEKLRQYMIEAAEQCERTALPAIHPMQKLTNFLENLPKERTLYFCDERGGQNSIEMSEISIKDNPSAAILIGPEGGFTDEENALIRAHPTAKPISLGPRILRAETAAIAAIAIWMTHNGYL